MECPIFRSPVFNLIRVGTGTGSVVDPSGSVCLSGRPDPSINKQKSEKTI
jgi:hypothetical protein